MASTSDELFMAIDGGDVARVRAILDAEPDLARARDAHGVSALLRARYRFDPALVDEVLGRVDALDAFEAASFGDVGRLDTILEADPGVAHARSADGFTALHLAAFFGQPAAAGRLLERGAEVDAPGTGWMTGTPLHSAASGSHTDVAALLLDAGADVDARQSGGWTPLHSAAANGNAALVGLLLARGADPAATNDEGRSVLELADGSGDPETSQAVAQALS